MYPLVRWKMLTTVLGLLTTLAVYTDDIAGWFGWELPHTYVARYLTGVLLALLSGIFASTGYWAPWRIGWRCFPSLNNWFPDLNGLWVGSTNSNWPTIKRLVEAAQQGGGLTEQELHDTPEQRDAMAVQIKASLFKLHICAGLSSTEARSYSIVAKPWRQQHTGEVHISYVYKQETPNHAMTDEEAHLGAAELIVKPERQSRAEGTYWTRRSWKTGRNTAGRLVLTRISSRLEASKTLRQHAAEHRDAPTI